MPLETKKTYPNSRQNAGKNTSSTSEIKTGILTGVRGKLMLSHAFFALLLLLTLVAFWWFINQEKVLRHTTTALTDIARKVQTANSLEKDFFIIEAINPNFYETGKSTYITAHRDLLARVRESLLRIKTESNLVKGKSLVRIDSTIVEINLFEQTFDSLVRVLLTRGFKSYGSEGDMRRAISRIDNSGYDVDKSLILSIRRHEKDYLLRKDKNYIFKLDRAIELLRESAGKKLQDNYAKILINSSLDQYKKSFSVIVKSDSILGIGEQFGLRSRLDVLSDAIEKNVLQIEQNVAARASGVRSSVQTSLLLLFILLLGLTLLLTSVISMRITRPIRLLSSSIRQVVEKRFDDSAKLYVPNTRDELKQLSLDANYMLDKVKKRTKEVIAQKEQVSRAYEDMKRLEEMGRVLSAELSVEKISQKLYQHICRLLPAELFFIGLKNEEEQVLEVRATSSEGKSLAKNTTTFNIPYVDRKQLAIWVVNTQEEIVSGHFSVDLQEKYEGLTPSVQDGKIYESVVYLPLISQNRTIGVLSLQAEAPECYDDYQTNILKNLVLYAVSAIENASMYEVLEERVEERTQEVNFQKTEIEQKNKKLEHALNNIKLLSEIGRLITSHLSLGKITEQMYESINKLMDAPVFGVGIYNPKKQQIDFENYIENHKKQPDIFFKLSDKDSYSAWCFNNNKEVVINDVTREYESYVDTAHKLDESENVPNSILYIPISGKRNVVGVITVQSYRTAAYTDEHLDLLRNLSIYLGIALDNASTYIQIEDQKNQIELRNQKITDSINYASRIQSAILPRMEKILRELPQSFILFKPRDIVSGDFYWFAKHKKYIVIAAIDCTGHGVPGAFMSMIGNNLLQHLVIEQGMTDPGKLLTEMHHRLCRILGEDNEEMRDGMDAALCVIDKKNNEMMFAGANNPLLFIQNDVHGRPQLYRIKGEKYSIGGSQKESKGARTFTTHTIKTSEPLEIWANADTGNVFEEPPKVTRSETTVYLFSDGFQDQFGGKKGRKFMARRFRNLLYDIHQKPMDEQKTILEHELRAWIDAYEKEVRQLDDVLVIGFRI